MVFSPLVPIILILTFASAMLLVIGITMRTERELIRERVDRYSTTGEAIVAPLHPEFHGTFGDRVIRPFLRSLSVLAWKLTPPGVISDTEAKLESAGHPWRLGVKEFLGLQLLCWIVFVFITYAVFRFLQPMGAFLCWSVSALTAFIGILLPQYMLQRAVNNRQMRIRKALPDTIDLLTVSVEAGVGFDGAMAKVAEKVRGPITEELVRALEEMRLGKPRMQALRDMAERVNMQEVRTFVAALYQAEQLGVSIAKVLRVQGETMRTRRSQFAREAAAKLPVKMLFPLVFFIFPALFVVVLGPGLIGIYKAFQ